MAYGRGVMTTQVLLCFIFALALLIVVSKAWIDLIKLFIGEANLAGFDEAHNGKLWLIGVFATPIGLGVYVLCFLLNQNLAKAGNHKKQAKDQLED